MRSGRGFAASLAAVAVALLCLPSTGFAIGDDGADGRFSRRESSHFVLFQDVDIDQTSGLRGSRRFEQDVLETLEEAYDQLESLLGMRPGRPLTVTVWDAGIFEQQFSGLFRFSAAGFFNGEIHVRGDTVVGAGLVRVLHHELVHAAFDALAPSLLLPAWFNEGLSEWFEARAVGQRRLSSGQRAYLASAARQGVLFSFSPAAPPSFARLGPDGARIAYLHSFAFFEHLARHHGERKLRELVRATLRTGNLERAFQRTYRADLERLEARYLEELRGD